MFCFQSGPLCPTRALGWEDGAGVREGGFGGRPPQLQRGYQLRLAQAGTALLSTLYRGRGRLPVRPSFKLNLKGMPKLTTVLRSRSNFLRLRLLKTAPSTGSSVHPKHF